MQLKKSRFKTPFIHFSNDRLFLLMTCNCRSRDGAVVRALDSQRCGSGSTPGHDAVCGLSLLLVIFSAPRGFSPVFPSSQKLTIPNSNSIQISVDALSNMDWVCWFSTLLRAVFPRVLRFPPLTKKQHLKLFCCCDLIWFVLYPRSYSVLNIIAWK